ncbi:related to acetylxylan esterase [Sporisorium reilianum f. sp. reilianum]|uniref:Related to acetylxylan esterase n=1 Tax=Sporisorium reilianum f. sp. reilianum TaxID=72559 RepID=A0A2N8UIJ5_9BASI|nr:related to acetylxylan esterase [Sporisorium reilianum f. sp. reilianum]
MRSFVSLIATSLLLASNSFAQGPSPWAGGPPGNGAAAAHAVDPLASNHWSALPGPAMPPNNGAGGGGWRPFGNPPSAGGQGGGMPGMPGMPGGGASGPTQGGGESQLKQETDFPGQPTKAVLYSYVPNSFKKGNAVVVALHHCGGSAPGFFTEHPDWAKMADQKGFLLLFGGSPEGSKGCWDVSSEASLKHDGGGDTQTVVNMVKFAQKKYGASDKVYVFGQSSGAMMSQALSAVYPDVFVAAAAFSGVPAGCFRTSKAIGPDWNSTCTAGTLNEPTQYWVQQAKGMYPGYTGKYPRMLLVHGDQDAIINFNDHREATKQWCGLHGFDADTPTQKKPLNTLPNYEMSKYGSAAVTAISAKGVTHDNPAKADLTCEFFGI